MNWNNLKSNKCPECSEVLTIKLLKGSECLKCGFMISETKFDKIVESMHKLGQKRCMTFDENLEMLNNL